ncbi:MAG: T9SS type A sorting domain-containing protein [Flavobacteriales bacterium]|nr:T9SS type A sorting domain-containing protein [Flavobacteriales bacterium]MCB9166372.1 T9SS type A sorting domain-containing protein [Flavobacteriales bacterium]
MIAMIFRTAILGGLLLTQVAAAQPNVDITLVDNGNNELEVRIRPDGDFSDFFSSIVFTIRWETASGAMLGNIAQVAPESTYMPMIKSGDEVDAGGFRYQVFAGFGTVPLNTLGVSWTANQEVTLMTIPAVNGSSLFEIVNDSWTSDIANNGDYYVSLNGLDVTGAIYTMPTGISMGDPLSTSLDVQPNPTDGLVILSFGPTMDQDLVLELTDQAGRTVLKEDLNVAPGAVRRTIDLTGMVAGVYTLRVISPERTFVRRIVRK